MTSPDSLIVCIRSWKVDLQINFSPISACLGSVGNRPDAISKGCPSPTQIFLNSAVIFGHRLFGLPPTEPTYVCNWDLMFGVLTGECSIDFIRALISSLKAFDFSLDDVENALPPDNVEIIHDITFVRVGITSIRVWLRNTPCAFLLSTDELKFDFNDWGRDPLSDLISLIIPNCTLACVDEDSAQKQSGKWSSSSLSAMSGIKTHAYITTDVQVSVLGIKPDAVEKRNLQQQHVRDHDFRTKRVGFLLHDEASPVNIFTNREEAIPPSMSVPSMPPPLNGMCLESSQIH